MTPHSKTVRGTFANPKTKTAIEAGQNPTQLGDPTSLHSGKDDSVSLDSVSAVSASQPADPYRQHERASSSSASNLSHSKTVRGTLGNTKGPEVNSNMLGDPVSLKAETSTNDRDRGAGPTSDQEQLKEAAEKRGEYEKRSGESKL